MADRLGRVTVLLVPRTRAHVKCGSLVGSALEQVRLQNIREESVIAVPLAYVVERDDEKVSLFECLEHCLAVVPFGYGITQRAVESFQDGRR